MFYHCARLRSISRLERCKMTRSRRPNWRRIKRHRNYEVGEAARTLGVCQGTVRRWIKSGLPALTDKKPTLILGEDLIAFHQAKASKRQTCRLDECYCVKCRTPRVPAGHIAEYVPISAHSGNLKAICPVCEGIMHTAKAKASIAALERILAVSFPQGDPRLMDSGNPSPNDHKTLEHFDNG
ncbi:MAG TPA: helix-turn-helix domain-containing protein [Devosiaceae bacterium]